MRCKVVIADDAAPTRVLFRELLDSHESIEVVAEAANGAEALAAVRHHQPDVLVLDLAMPGMDGLEVLLALRDDPVDARVVVLSGFARDRMAPVVLEAGASAYLEKGVRAEAITRTVLDACASKTL